MSKILLDWLRWSGTLPMTASSPAAEPAPVRESTPAGEVVSLDRDMHEIQYLDWHYAPARSDGPGVVLSGVVAAAREGVALGIAEFDDELRRAFSRIDQLLVASGSGGDLVVEMTSYHVFESPWQTFSKADHINAFRRIKDEYIRRPYPAWTAIGVADLIPSGGLVEIRVVARRRHPLA